MIASWLHPALLTLAAGGIGLPPEASTVAPQTDFVWNVVFWVTLFFFLLVVGIMLVFIVKYRRRPNQPYEPAVTHNTPLEITWTLVPLAIVLVFFWMGVKTYIFENEPPSDSYQIDVRAQKWRFTFSYPNGGESGVLYVPVNTDVQLNLTSVDVLHGCYIPAFRVQKNLVPGRTLNLWFRATKTTPQDASGKYIDDDGYTLFCNQYCGAGHSQMHTTVVVMDRGAFSAKLAELSNIFVDPATKKPIPLHVVGEKLYSQFCASCHTVNGGQGTGPTWKDLYGSQVHLSDGTTVTALLPYINESIMEPSAQIVQGFTPAMPSFDGQLNGSPYKDLKRTALIAYIMSLSPDGQQALPAFEAAHPVPMTGNAAPASGPAAVPSGETPEPGAQPK